MKIATKGCKAHDVELELGHLTLLVGPNGSGKSTVADAVRFAALGYIPALGKRPVDTAALLQDGQMSVDLVLEDGRAIRRTLERLDKGFATGAEASWIRNAKGQETAKTILGLFGDEELDVAECLDIRELLASTPNQKVARVEQLITSNGPTPETKAKAVARYVVMRVAKTTEDRMPEDYLQALPMVPAAEVAILRETSDMLYAKIVDSGIPAALSWANEEKRAAATGVRAKEQARRELQLQLIGQPEPTDEQVADLARQLGEIQRLIGARQAELRGWTERSQAIGRARTQASAADETLAGARKAHSQLEAEVTPRLLELRIERDRAQVKLGELKAPAPRNQDERIAKLQKEAAALETEAGAIVLPEVPDVLGIAKKHAEVLAKLEVLKGSQWAEVLEISDEIEGKATTKGVKVALQKPIARLRELARAGLGQDPEELRHEAKRLAIERREIEEKADKIARDRKALVEKGAKLYAQARAKRADAGAIGAEASDEYQDAVREFEAEREGLHRAATEATDAIEALAKAVDVSAEHVRSVESEYGKAHSRLQALGAPGEQPADPGELVQRAQALQEELARFQRAQASHREFHAIEKRIEADQARHEVFSAIEWALQRQREVEISEAGGGLLKTMKEFLQAAGRKEEPYIRAGAGSCAIGWRTPEGREVQIQALSGGEWCLFAAALTAGVVLARPSALKILLVEAGETDERHLVQLLQGIRGVAEGLTAAIVMTPRGPGPGADVEGWTVTRTERTELAKSA